MAFHRSPGGKTRKKRQDAERGTTEYTNNTEKEERKAGKQTSGTQNKKFLVVKFKSDIIAFEL